MSDSLSLKMFPVLVLFQPVERFLRAIGRIRSNSVTAVAWVQKLIKHLEGPRLSRHKRIQFVNLAAPILQELSEFLQCLFALARSSEKNRILVSVQVDEYGNVIMASLGGGFIQPYGLDVFQKNLSHGKADVVKKRSARGACQ